MPKVFWEHSREANLGWVGKERLPREENTASESWAKMGRRLSGAGDSMDRSVESCTCTVGLKWNQEARRSWERGGGPILRPSAVRLRDMGLTGESIWGSFLKKPRYSSYQKFPARGQPLLLRTRHGDSFMTGPCISYSKFNEQKKMPLPEESQYCIFDFLLKNFWLGSVGGMELSCFMILIKCLLIKKNP